MRGPWSALWSRPEGPLFAELLTRYDTIWLFSGIGLALALGLAPLATLFGCLRWRVPGPFWLAGAGLSALIGQALAIAAMHSEAVSDAAIGAAMLLDATGMLWGVTACMVAAGGLALVQAVGVTDGRFTIGRAIVPGLYGFVAAALLGLQGLGSDVPLVGGLYALWMVWLGCCLFLGGLRADASARHAAGRVLLAFLAVIGTGMLAVATDHLVYGLTMLQVAEATPARGAVILLDMDYTFSNVRRMGFVAVALATMGGAAGLGGALMPASDMRGSLSGLVGLGGLVIIGICEIVFLGLS